MSAEMGYTEEDETLPRVGIRTVNTHLHDVRMNYHRNLHRLKERGEVRVVVRFDKTLNQVRFS